MDVLSLGIYVVDVLGRPIDRFPEKGKLALFDELEIHAGGCANNVAIALARLGISAGAMGKVGTDAFGDLILRGLADDSINAIGMRQDANATTSFTFVAVASDGERTFYHYIGANGEFCEADLDWEIIRSAKILQIAGALTMPNFDGAPMANVLRKAKTLGITTSLDTVYDATGKWMETLEPCLPYVDIFMPSIIEAQNLTGLSDYREITQFFRNNYDIHTIVIKMGENGSYASTPEAEHFAPAYPVEVIDGTGAGDAYVAGFLAGIIMDWDLKARTELASATGAACVTAMGTTAGIQNLEETLKISNQQSAVTDRKEH